MIMRLLDLASSDIIFLECAATSDDLLQSITNTENIYIYRLA